ncbi:acetyl esterase/lipase [Paenibacillus shirakamiensis]|uniref:Acetyl esterase/lipase n=1 Tax=Paenibacillus shirakamiensis TaxID=1265935 RepID=A0ABS4JCD7_9BACL|nr:alpha/beta hydrolase [Paenibacillus shirakamiensis]MBP1999384.1 acetyl esterase/lipase [Paenibacillus shirakamiensis]
MTGRTNKEELAKIRQYLQQNQSFQEPVERIRQNMDYAINFFPEIPDLCIETVYIDDLYGEWISVNKEMLESDAMILYFHGGGFVSGSCLTYRDLAARIARSSGVKVLVVEYRLAPEHPYPAANEDCMNTYLWLLNQRYESENMILGGDSIGGSLVLMTLLSLLELNKNLSAGTFLLSPHANLVRFDGESYTRNASIDPTGSIQTSQLILDRYLSYKTEPEQVPSILSPLSKELRGLPSLLIQVGGVEVLVSDAVRLAEKARKANVQVQLEVWEHMWSVFQMFAYQIPEAEQAIQNIGRFVRDNLHLS